ncbi:MAG: hypothetical protein ACOX8U_10625 [Bradymonadia bacterium]|jgi:hypothetical protein
MIKRLPMYLLSLGLGLSLMSCGDDGRNDNNNNNGGNEGKETFTLTYPNSQALTLKVDGSDDIRVKYRNKDGEGATGRVITAVSKDDDCVKVDAEQTTGSNGNALFEVRAGSDSCESTITLTSDNASLDPIVVKITVNEQGNVDEGKGEIVIVDPSGSLKLEIGSSGKVTVKYNNEAKVAVPDADLILTSSDETCVKAGSKLVQTADDGKATFTVRSVGETCSASVKIAVSGLEEVHNSVNVIVGQPLNFDAIANLVYKGTMDGTQVDTMTVGLLENVNDCTPYLNDPNPEVFDESFDRTVSVPGYDLTIDATAKLKVETAKSPATLVAFGVTGEGSSRVVVAYGCQSGYTLDKQEQELVVHTYQPKLIGTYKLLSNFDLTSGFQKTSGGIPKVEAMLAGDWVEFTNQLFQDSLKTLLDFVYVNLILRVTNEVNWQPLEQLAEPHMRELVVSAISEILKNKYLKDYKWFEYVEAIGPDISDLITNMQLEGSLKINEEPNARGILTNNQLHSYERLNYRWSLQRQGEELVANPNCKEPSYTACREGMRLTSANSGVETMSGVWGGNVAACAAGNCLNIDGHAMTFGWATILYNAVFGNILPKALGYNVGNSTDYLSLFFENILFRPLVNNYNSDPENVSVSITEGYCPAFVEVLLRLLATSTEFTWLEDFINNNQSVVASVGKMACEKGFDSLETALTDKLAEFKITAENNILFSSKNCPLGIEGTDYHNMGWEDDPAQSANTILKDVDPKTNRCIWNINFQLKDTPVTIKGLFHAVLNNRTL